MFAEERAGRILIIKIQSRRPITDKLGTPSSQSALFRHHISGVHLNMISNVTLWHWLITAIIRNHFIKQFVRPVMRAYCVETRLISVVLWAYP